MFLHYKLETSKSARSKPVGNFFKTMVKGFLKIKYCLLIKQVINCQTISTFLRLKNTDVGQG